MGIPYFCNYYLSKILSIINQNVMKQLFTLILLATSLMATAQSKQTIINFPTGDYYNINATNPLFSYDGKVSLFVRSKNYDIQGTDYNILDDDFNVTKTFSIARNYEEMATKRVTKRRAQTGAEIKKSGDADKEPIMHIEYYDNSQMDYIHAESPFTLAQVNVYYTYQYQTSTRSRMMKETAGGAITQNYIETSEGYVFPISYYEYYDEAKGMSVKTDYPQEYLLLTYEGLLFHVHQYYQRQGIYQGEWTEEVVEGTTSEYLYVYIDFKDFDNTNFESQHIELTQTLFNQDEKYEYITPKYTYGLNQLYVTDRDEDGEVDEKVFYYGPVFCGLQVMSEEGAVLKTIDFGFNFQCLGGKDNDCTLFRKNGKFFMAFNGEILNEQEETKRSVTLVFEIDNAASSIRKVMEHVGMSVSPRIADRQDVINVELDETVKEGAELLIVNAAGQTVSRLPLKPGQKQVAVSARELSKGMNILQVKGSKSGTAKVIVK